MKFWFILFFPFLLFAVDFDCVFVGSSPIPLFEALYQASLGKKVLILEQAEECGGAWKAIDICGVSHVDLGCHQIGNDLLLKEFLEIYGGCQMLSLGSSSYSEFYFSHGCGELIDHLLRLISAADIALLLNHRLESAYVDLEQQHVVVKAKDKQFTTKKIYYTSMTSFHIENNPLPPTTPSSKYYHLYLLLQDPSPPKFYYLSGGIAGTSRMMNLTSFADLKETGRQLIVFQVHGESFFDKGERFLEELKKKNLVEPSAYILKVEPLIYETAYFREAIPSHWKPFFEMINASSFNAMCSYIGKWKSALKPYREIFP